jgi:hypothetical protein
MALDCSNHANVAIVIATVTVAAVVSDTVITSGAIVAVDSVVRVPSVVSIVIFVKRPGAEETCYCWVLLGRLVVVLLFQGGVVPFPGHVVIVIFIFQFRIGEELEVFTISQGLVVL